MAEPKTGECGFLCTQVSKVFPMKKINDRHQQMANAGADVTPPPPPPPAAPALEIKF